MATLNKVEIPTAIERKSKLSLPFDHVTTMSFMTPQPVGYRHPIKGEKLNVSCIANVRPMPMPVPTYGRMRMNVRGFFVPYRLVMPNWDSFYNDNIASNYGGSAIPTGVPIISNDEITTFFTSSTCSTVVTSGGDFVVAGVNYQFTLFGRYAYKIMLSLGYDILGSDDKDDPMVFNALALLAYAKIIIDWYANSQYLDSFDFLTLEQLMKYNDPAGQLRLTAGHLIQIFSFTSSVTYDSNGYFENAWDNPVAPNGGQFTSFSFADPTSNSGSYVTTNVNGTPEMKQDTTTSLSLGTTYLHEALKRLSDYQHRHALSGARSIDRVLSQYGFVADNLKQQRSVYIGFTSVDIGVGDVYATADGSNGVSNSSVGDYAGRAFGRGNKSWDYTTDEEGIFIVIASILPSGGYYQGYDRNNRHLTKRDFFIPEFDALGVQAIEKGEVFVSRDDTFTSRDSRLYKGTFGFTGRYGEYKRSISRVTGDISLPRIIQGGNSWHLMREFDSSSFSNSVANVSHSLGFTKGLDAYRYNRIFNYVESDYDQFFVFFHFDITSYAPCRQLFETYDFDSEGKKLTLETNGGKVN